ncbi:hypothetical protein ABW21_db0204355 [Orbilia brochopaga]|nr:hypothetical protein ABW21_db0204355 [Drechslerella brochopaga]
MYHTLLMQCAANSISAPSPEMMVAVGITSPIFQELICASLLRSIHQKVVQRGNSSGPVQNQHLTQVHQQPGPAQQTSELEQPQVAPAELESQGGIRAASANATPAPVRNTPTQECPAARGISAERPEFHIFVTDWGAKLPGWKLIPGWRHVPADLQAPEGNDSKFFTYFRRCVSPIVKLESNTPGSFGFIIDDANISKSHSKTNRAEGTASDTRPVQNLTKLYRLRCVSSKSDLTEHQTMSEWRSLETNWPLHFFAELNREQNLTIGKNSDASLWDRELVKKRMLHFRRKINWGKDCPTDITDGLENGKNTIEYCMYEPPRDGSAYYIAVEEVEVADYDTVFNRITEEQVISEGDARTAVIKRIVQSADAITVKDADVALADENEMSMPIICPNSQRMMDVPVRGQDCKHLECFDLKSFLTGRVKLNSGFSVPDGWGCPICGCECTPASLIVDGYMRQVIRRMKLMQEEDKHLNTTCIFIETSGRWRPNTPRRIKKVKKKKEPVFIDLTEES